MIDLTMNESQIKSTVQRARERDIILPTFSEMRNPLTIPQKIKDELKNIDLWDVNSRNLFRITF